MRRRVRTDPPAGSFVLHDVPQQALQCVEEEEVQMSVLVCEDCVIAALGSMSPGEETCMGFWGSVKCSACGKKTPSEKMRQPRVWPRLRIVRQ